MTAQAIPGSMKRRPLHPLLLHACGWKSGGSGFASLERCNLSRPTDSREAGGGGGRWSQTISGTNAACMHSKSHVLALFGNPGMNSVGSTGCVWFGRRLSSWKHSPVGAPVWALHLEVGEIEISLCAVLWKRLLTRIIVDAARPFRPLRALQMRWHLMVTRGDEPPRCLASS